MFHIQQWKDYGSFENYGCKLIIVFEFIMIDDVIKTGKKSKNIF